jgi:3-hydroxybutyryl-CoA dehydratase
VSALDWSAPFEDLRTGQALRTRGRTVTEADVVAFAALTGDRHPQHCDADWAASSRFGERIAHGMLIVSYAVGLMPFDPDRVLALRRISDVVFKRPLRIGETITVDGRIAELSRLDERIGLVGCALSVRKQGEELVCRARIDVLWQGGEAARGCPQPGDPARGEPARADVGGQLAGEARTPPAFSYPSGVFPC